MNSIITDATKIIDAAKKYIIFGFNIVHTRIDNPKAPAAAWKHLKECPLGSIDLSVFNDSPGLGAVTGINNIRCIDIDNCQDEGFIIDILECLKLPIEYPWIVKSGSSNGYHIWIKCVRHPFNDCNDTLFFNAKNENLFKQIELRWNSFTILPPSLHTSGNRYSFIDSSEVPDADLCFVEIDNIEGMIYKYCTYVSQENNGIDLDINSDDLSRLLRSTYSLSKNKYGDFFDDDGTCALNSFFSNCIHYDVPIEKAQKYIFDIHGNRKEIWEISEGTYSRYANQRGIKNYKPKHFSDVINYKALDKYKPVPRSEIEIFELLIGLVQHNNSLTVPCAKSHIEDLLKLNKHTVHSTIKRLEEEYKIFKTFRKGSKGATHFKLEPNTIISDKFINHLFLYEHQEECKKNLIKVLIAEIGKQE